MPPPARRPSRCIRYRLPKPSAVHEHAAKICPWQRSRLNGKRQYGELAFEDRPKVVIMLSSQAGSVPIALNTLWGVVPVQQDSWRVAEEMLKTAEKRTAAESLLHRRRDRLGGRNGSSLGRPNFLGCIRWGKVDRARPTRAEEEINS